MIPKADIYQIQKQLANGSHAALKQLYAVFSKRLMHLAFTIVHNKEQSEEIVADVFIRIWEKRERIKVIENFNLYLYTATKNISLNYLRKENKNAVFNLESVSLPYYLVEPEALQNLFSNELQQQINKAINGLPPKCKLIFKLVKEDRISYKEVASLLGIKVKTVENHKM